jgi:GR25 family glycosyltransferase involved in LPS biosynthesis
MHRLNKEFDKVITVNLLERRDKRDKMQARLDQLGIETEWFSAVQYGFAPSIVPAMVKAGVAHFTDQYPHEFGASMSHYTVIKTAYLENVKKLFVFEDDALFRKDFNEQFDKYMDKVPDNWDMIMLYSFMFQILPQNLRVNSRWIKSYKAWSHMAFGMNRNMMKAYIDFMDKKFMIADHSTYMLQETSNLNIYSAVPTLCIPNAKMGSNIRGEQLNYVQHNTAINMGINNDIYE